MRRLITLCSTLALLATSSAVFGQFEHQQHPRLWLRQGAEAALQAKVASDPLAAQLQQSLLEGAKAVLGNRTCRYEIPDGRRLLAESRLALQQTMLCAWAFRTTGDRKFLKRATAELEAACAMQDWNPSHFLDTAEMATAVAVGYDWLHDQLTPAQRRMCETAIRDKALTPARALYNQQVWWNNARNNWSQVCGSGIALAAMAIQGQDQGLSAGLIEDGIALVQRCDHFYAPDGLYPEGPGYWHYGTNYHVMLIAACQALDHPIQVPAVLEASGTSMIHLHSPTLLPFNFADGKARPQIKTPAQAWIAHHFDHPAQTRDLRAVLESTLDQPRDHANHRFSPLHLAWLPAAPTNAHSMPLQAVFHGEQATAVFRTGWHPAAAWLAIKGGTATGGHSQMDVGSFCYDAHGLRWIHDLGSDNYNLPGYFGSQRFHYFRNQNRSHNTLEIHQQLQDPAAPPCPITEYSLGGAPAAATFDLTAAYHASAHSVHRTATFDTTTGDAIIHDEIEQPAGKVAWRIVTDATATIRGNSVTLTKQGKSITLDRLSNSGSWSIEAATPPLAGEDPNTGFCRVTLTVQKKDRIAIRVAIRP